MKFVQYLIKVMSIFVKFKMKCVKLMAIVIIIFRITINYNNKKLNEELILRIILRN